MSRHLAFVIAYSAGLMLLTATSVAAAQFGTAEEAKAMLEKAASDGIVTAHPYANKGKQLRDILGKKGYPLGEEMMQKATEGTIREVTYWWPRPGTDMPLEKISYYTKVGDQICGVGYYKG
jgi:hypothetical protein